MTDERERLREALPSIEEVASALYETDPPESWMRTGTDEYRKRATAMLDIIVRDAVGLHDPDHPFPQSCIDPSHAALAHDRPSGSGLRATVDGAFDKARRMYVSPAHQADSIDAAIGDALNEAQEGVRAALSSSSDPEAGGLPTSVDPVVGLKCPMCGGTGRIFDVTAAIEDAQRAGDIRLVEPAARTEAKPETPQYTPGGLRYPTVGELHGEPSTEPMLRTSRQARGTGMSIDEAWAEAEKALPDDWSFGLTPYWDHGRWFGWEVEAHAATYEFDDNRALSTGTLGAFPDPVTALRALLARLTEAKPETPA